MADPNKPANWRSSKLLRGVNSLQRAAKDLAADASNPFGDPAKQPQMSTGGRAYIVVAGKPLALAQKVAWRISTSYEEIRTVDTHLSWDIVPGQTSISVTLGELVDPLQPAETEGTWATVASVIHQPIIELEIFDKLGERMFFARGMFVSMSQDIGMGALASRSLEFVGITYASNVSQSFKPYADTNKVAEAFQTAAKTLKSWTGGIL